MPSSEPVFLAVEIGGKAVQELTMALLGSWQGGSAARRGEDKAERGEVECGHDEVTRLENGAAERGDRLGLRAEVAARWGKWRRAPAAVALIGRRARVQVSRVAPGDGGDLWKACWGRVATISRLAWTPRTRGARGDRLAAAVAPVYERVTPPAWVWA
jgi:hypothetical protein